MAHNAKPPALQSFTGPFPQYGYMGERPTIQLSNASSATPNANTVAKCPQPAQVKPSGDASDQLPPQSRWLTVKKMAQIYADVTSEAALRNLIWQAEAYEKFPKSGLASNGFLPVIVRPPKQRKVLLDRAEFEKWLTSQQRVSKP